MNVGSDWRSRISRIEDETLLLLLLLLLLLTRSETWKFHMLPAWITARWRRCRSSHERRPIGAVWSECNKMITEHRVLFDELWNHFNYSEPWPLKGVYEMTSVLSFTFTYFVLLLSVKALGRTVRVAIVTRGLERHHTIIILIIIITLLRSST